MMLFQDAHPKKQYRTTLEALMLMMTIQIQIHYHQPQDNPRTHTCCGGNANNFESLEECNTKCKIATPPKMSLNVCSLKPEAGPCEAIQVRYYYNQENETCEKFVYGGCGGNANRFISID